MLTNKQSESLTVVIPNFGECTLLSIDTLPEKYRKYEKMVVNAEVLGMKEFQDLSRNDMQEIFKALAFRLSERGVETTEGISVILSGAHDAYPRIDITDKNQKMEKCVTAIQFFFWNEARLSDKNELIGGPVDKQLDEIPVDEFIPVMEGDSTYFLFIGV
jgi:hypothetical protein